MIFSFFRQSTDVGTSKAAKLTCVGGPDFNRLESQPSIHGPLGSFV